MNRFQENLINAIDKIEKARISVDRHRIIRLVAVSKYSSTQEIQALYECGQRAFGENKVIRERKPHTKNTSTNQ